MEAILNWLLRAVFIALGVGAGAWIVQWLRTSWKVVDERWTVRLGVGMLALASLYGAGHVRLLAQRASIEEGRQSYTRFGDPRRTEERRAEVRGWLIDCTGEPAEAFALYRQQRGSVQRTYPIGEAGANFIGGGEDAELRDYTVERLFAPQLRRPMSLREAGQLHPAGTDLRLTLCSDLTAETWRLLRATGRPGGVIVQDVATGAIISYAATGTAEQAPLGIRRYAPPGSVFKLALAAVWWENGLPDNTVIPCPAQIQITPRATISNSGGFSLGTVIGPAGMLVPSCNTSAVWMAQQMREQLGEQAFIDAYRAFGFEPYSTEAPRDTTATFWSTDSRAWARRMTPSPSRIRMSEETGAAEWAQLSIGQGPIDVTVIGVSRFMQAIGNDGVMLRPTIEWERGLRPEGAERVMREETARRLQSAMLEVVRSGTARSVAPRIRGTGWTLGGKTGTSQVAGARDDGWFAGLMHDESERPRYSVVVYLQGGGPGGAQPASIAAELTRRIAARPPEGDS
jgi:cell division protein FtsI/penicillin-binding protein 2